MLLTRRNCVFVLCAACLVLHSSFVVHSRPSTKPFDALFRVPLVAPVIDSLYMVRMVEEVEIDTFEKLLNALLTFRPECIVTSAVPVRKRRVERRTNMAEFSEYEGACKELAMGHYAFRLNGR